MTKILYFVLKIKGGGREGGTCEVLRLCHPLKIWNVHKFDFHFSQNPGPCRIPGPQATFRSQIPTPRASFLAKNAFPEISAWKS